MDDRIRINGLHLLASVLGSAWPSKDTGDARQAELQPVIVSIDIHHDLESACRLDDISHSVDYSRLSKKIRDACITPGSQELTPEMPYDLAERILDSCLKEINQPVQQVVVELEFPKLVLRAKCAGVTLIWTSGEATSKKHGFFINELPVHAVVGLRDHERLDKQPVLIHLEFDHFKIGYRELHFSFSKLEKRISECVEASAYMTIETLTSQIARECFSTLEDPASFMVTVSLRKPAAITMAQSPEIRITRSLSDFPSLQVTPSSEGASTRTLAALALGANLSDRFQNIELALRYLEDVQSLNIPGVSAGELTIVDTSFLYESEPMYVESQPSFINCACLVETTLSPSALLRVCKYIEKTVGRVPSERFGPRVIDVDIITFGEQVIDTRAHEDRSSLENLEGQLVIPHPRMAEREFVLRPLKDIIPEWVHPQLHLSIRSLLAKLTLGQRSTLDRVIPFPFSPEIRAPAEYETPATQTYWILPSSHGRQPKRHYIMATLNVTPDSFSDGGDHAVLTSALSYARSAVASGADIIDVGGYSTRPGAQDVSPAEEIARVVPVIRAIRGDSDEKFRNILISIDTFRADVARAALDAGANCINDVYAFSGGPEFYSPPQSPSQSETGIETEKKHFEEMQALASSSAVPVILMHSRGHADKNKDYTLYSNTLGVGVGVGVGVGEDRGVIEGVRFELSAKVTRALRGGRGKALRRWQVVVDPGIGFSKDVSGNLQVLRRAGELVEEGFLPPGAADIYSTKAETSIPSSNTSSSRNSNSYTRSNPYTTPIWNPLANYPLLIGPSRKSFLGALISTPLPASNRSNRDENKDNDQLAQRTTPAPPPLPPTTTTTTTQRPPKERDFATAATIACAIQQGAAIVRVHAVREMADVVKVASALWP